MICNNRNSTRNYYSTFSCSSDADAPSINFTRTTTARLSDSSGAGATASATGSMVTSGPEYPDVYIEGRTASMLTYR